MQKLFGFSLYWRDDAKGFGTVEDLNKQLEMGWRVVQPFTDISKTSDPGLYLTVLEKDEQPVQG